MSAILRATPSTWTGWPSSHAPSRHGPVWTPGSAGKWTEGGRYVPRERQRLILSACETPLSGLHLRNMAEVSAGPGEWGRGWALWWGLWLGYTGPSSMEDDLDHMVGSYRGHGKGTRFSTKHRDIGLLNCTRSFGEMCLLMQLPRSLSLRAASSAGLNVGPGARHPLSQGDSSRI